MSNIFNVDIDEYLPLRDIVFNSIRDAIISNTLKPGERLMEKYLAEQIGVSRTPVREALRKLEAEGFVEMVPRKGAMVANINEQDIKDVLQIRGVLEGLAGKLACNNISKTEINELEKVNKEFEEATKTNDLELMVEKDIAFHDLIFVYTKNKKLVAMINNLREQIYRFRLTYLKDPEFRKQILFEHEKIIQAIKERNEKEAERLSKLHVNNQEKVVVIAMNKKNK